jgi:plastocyanin
MVRNLLCALVLASAASPLVAAPLNVRVVDASGRPVRDAVVTLYPAGAAHPAHAGGRYVVAQQNLQFRPFLTVVPVGADVSFPNLDPTKHHVYSFSAAKKFELKLFAKDQSRTVHFDKPGVVALGCNIHDQMSAFIIVVDTPYFERTGGDGHATLRDVEPGRYVVHIWYPEMRDEPQPGSITVAGGERVDLSFVTHAHAHS